MAVPLETRTEMHRILLQGEPWAQILKPEPARPVTLPKPEPRLPTANQKCILQVVGPLEELTSKQIAQRLGLALDRLSSDLYRVVQLGWLYQERSRTLEVNFVYGITDEGLAAASRPTLEESKVRPLKEIVLTASPNLIYDRPKPEPQAPHNPDDWLNTGARWVRKDELVQLSSPCRVVQTARTAEADEPPKSEPRPRPGSTQRARKNPVQDPRRAEVVRLYHEGHNLEDMKGILRIGSATLKRIMELEGLSIRPSCIRPKKVGGGTE
mgnify:CR=1 FL=1